MWSRGAGSRIAMVLTLTCEELLDGDDAVPFLDQLVEDRPVAGHALGVLAHGDVLRHHVEEARDLKAKAPAWVAKPLNIRSFMSRRNVLRIKINAKPLGAKGSIPQPHVLLLHI